MSLTGLAQRGVRALHRATLCRALPDQIALYFHGVEAADWNAFEQLVGFLCRERGYSATDPSGFVAPSSLPRLLISFDDNYMSWYNARRLFDRLRTRVTFYVNTLPFESLEGSPEVEDYFRRLGYSGLRAPLTREKLRALHADGHTIGAHTHSHADLATLPIVEARREITLSKALLEEIVGTAVVDFAYPYGMRRNFSESLRSDCLAAGFSTVANGIPGLLHSVQRPERIQRSPWLLHRSLDFNLTNLRIDGRLFERVTGRSAVG